MNEKQDENTVEQVLRGCRLQVERYPKNMAAPDFKVSGARGEFFLCEVKSIRSPADKPVSGDTLYGAITNKVQVASEQFAAVNSNHFVPNVLVWVTHNPRYNRATFLDLVSGRVVIQGEIIADLRKQRLGKFNEHFRRIDAFVWLHPWGAPEVLYNQVCHAHTAMLTRLLADLPLQEL